MEIILNNNPDFIETSKKSITVAELLALKNFSYKLLVVKVNNTLVRKDQYSSATVKDGDNVQVIHLITGG
ncbi:MAG: sulfur carrier protein ThiS [Bacteroidales bacterium]|jgi:thiamine biosynthesis protein ThiS